MALYSTKYVRGVVDYLSAGRLCGRYVLLAGDMANGISILSIVMSCENTYYSGYAMGLWGKITIPISMTLGLFGFCIYRFRETKAQSFGQFLEIRYGSKWLRIFAATIRTIAELLAHAIMPAIAGRFFLYFLGFPKYITFLGMEIDVFFLLMAICISMAIFIICCGGILSIVITDAIQGMFCLPLIVFFSVFLITKFNFFTEVAPVLMDRAPGESFLNPYDVLRLRDFNLLSMVLGIITMFLHGASWIGGGTTSAAISPHEQKMASILGRWRGFFSPLLYLLISLTIFTTLNHEKFSSTAREIRNELCARVACDVVQDNQELQQKLIANIEAIPEQKHRIGIDPPLGQKKNLDTIYIDTARRTFEEAGLEDSAHRTQQFRTIYHQTMMAVSMRKILSPWMMGLFCLLAILAMVSTDDSYIFSSVLTIVQDVILPFFKKPPSLRLHIWLFRIVAIIIGVMFLLVSANFAQLDFLTLFITTILSLWLGGCGPMVTFALYGTFGNKYGAWTSLLTGMFLAIFSIFLQQKWANIIYPFFEDRGWVETIGAVLDKISKPFNPIIIWEMNPEKCPINSYELYLINMIITLLVYVGISYATYQGPFNLDRMLHRGKYNVDGTVKSKVDWRIGNILNLIAGITDEHTRWDKVVSYSLVIYSYGFSFLVCFVMLVIWNAIVPWPLERWAIYFLVVSIIVPSIAVAITSVWFGVGGFIGIFQLFKRLNNREVDPLDNGMVCNGVSLADQAKFAAIENTEEEKSTEKADKSAE